MPIHTKYRSTNLKILISQIILFTLVCSQVTWTDLSNIRASTYLFLFEGQTSVYDDAYIPLGVTSQVTIVYKTAIVQPVKFAIVVLSGFQNYLSYEMIFLVKVFSASLNSMVLDVYVGPQSYVKQFNVNYFVMETSATVDPYFQISIANYRTTDLDSGTGLRKQQFTNQTTTFPTPVSIVSAMHGLQYYNHDGVVNEVNIKTWKVAASNIIHQQISVDEKGILNYLHMTTLLVASGFYPTPNNYAKVATSFQTTLTQTTGYTNLNAISISTLYQQTSNSLFFGLKGFKFSMEGTRLFLLQITTEVDYTKNLKSNAFMNYGTISVILMANRACPTVTDYYYVQGFTCQPACTGLLDRTAQLVCQDCLTICDGCTNTPSECVDCIAGNNRILQTGPNRCACDYANGYVDIGKDICQKCSDYLVGCLKCPSSDTCDDCGDPLIFQKYDYTGTSKFACRCLGSKFLVTGVCLSYPGCIQANIYVTGEFCENCSDAKNFQKNLVVNSSCICKTAYFLNPLNNICEDKCGDQKTPETPTGQTTICDDGNTLSGDGCSSKCTEEYGYLCTVKTVGGLSTCAQKQQLKIAYLYAQKTLNANQAIIVFSLLPAQHFLAATAFQNSISLNVNGNKKIRFDPITSLIYITVDYTSSLQGNQYDFNFTFSGLNVYSPDINLQVALSGFNAKLQTSEKPQQTNLITYVGLAISAFALALALIVSFLGEKLVGIQLILPVQAAFFTMATLPKSVMSPISALWSMKFSSGYNSLQTYDISTNYMLDSRVGIMQYAGQYILNYNIMFILLATSIAVIGLIAIRIAWLQRQEKRLEGLQKKKQQSDKDQPKKKKKDKKQKSSQNQKDQQQETQQQTHKDEQMDMESLEDELEDVRQNIKNWKNFMYMIFDRFFTILIITAMMKVIFCFYVQLSNLTYTAEIYDNSLNAGFFFLTYATIITGLYAIIYDYKTDKLVLFTCNKGKYAIIYIFIFVGYIIILGAIFQTSISVYVSAVFSLMPIILIPYQVPYGLGICDFQNIIAVICQLPFLITAGISVMLNLKGEEMSQSMCFIFAYAILGSVGLSVILSIIRLIRVIDCKKISCVQFTDRKKQNANDKNKKKNKVVLLQLDMQKDWDQFSEDSVRGVLFQKRKKEKSDDFNIEIKNKQGYQGLSKKNQLKKQQKKLDQQDDDEEIDELEKIKLKLRKQLKQKKASGKIK